MKKINVITYLAERNRGSEFEVGILAERYLGSLRGRIFMPAFQFYRYNGRARKINSVIFKQTAGLRVIVKIGSALKEPSTPNQFRIGFVLWLFKCRFLLRNLNGIYWFVTLAQLLSPAPIIFIGKKYVLGPAGGQAKFWQFSYLKPSLRIKNFLLREIFYPLYLLFVDHNSIVFCHPSLAKNNYKVIPAIHQIPKKNFIQSIKDKNSIIFVGRKMEIKMTDCVYEIFTKLSIMYPKYNFKIIGEGWESAKISPNFEIYSGLSRVKVQNIFKTSILHVFLSFELAGFVLFEAVKNGCPNFTLQGFGSDYLVSPSEPFKVSPNVSSKDELAKNAVKKIAYILNNKHLLKNESKRQYSRSLNFTIDSKFLSINSVLTDRVN